MESDPNKVEAIVDWPTLTTLNEARSFHGATLYRRLSEVSAYYGSNNWLYKESQFVWTWAASQVFEEVRKQMTAAPVFRVPDFSKVFELARDASHVGICSCLAQWAIRLHSLVKSLVKLRKKYSTYDKELYAMVQALCYWRHYLILRNLCYLLIVKL